MLTVLTVLLLFVIGLMAWVLLKMALLIFAGMTALLWPFIAIAVSMWAAVELTKFIFKNRK